MVTESVILRHPSNSGVEDDGGSYIVRVPGSAGVALDEALARLWQLADGQTAEEMVAQLPENDRDVMSELLALRYARLLLPPIYAPVSSPPRPISDPPLVSVVIVSRNGRHYLKECLPSLESQTYPHLELILVDDASTDGTKSWLRTQFPAARYLSQENGPNFAAGCNLGIAHAAGELIFLLNNDTVLEPDCLQMMVAAYLRSENVGGVAAMLRFYDNRPFVNGLGTSIRRFGFGYDLGIGNLDIGQFQELRRVPLLCFGAALIPRAALEKTGAIEEAYRFYFEDADWSYRARTLGFDLVAAPGAIVYHKFSGTTGALTSAFKTRLATRNRLWFVLKNFPVWAVLWQSFFYGLDDSARLLLHLVRGESALAQAILRAWGEYWRGVPLMLRARRETKRKQGKTAVPLRQLTRPFPVPQMYGALPRLSQELVMEQYKPYLQQSPNVLKRRRALIISPDSVNANMGGVGIRYWELSHQLAGIVDVTLAIPNETDLTAETFTICRYGKDRSHALKRLAETADIILLSGFTVYHHPFLRQANAYIIVDLYDPVALENLERFADKPPAEREALHRSGVVACNELLELGDYFICASEKQRDYWLGALTTVNRITPAIYTADNTLRRLIDTVPFGLPDTPPVHTKAVLKGVRPGITASDKVILWGGGLWDWLDPLTLIRAMPFVLEKTPQARLFFLGIKHPNPDVPPSRMAAQTVALATKMGLKEKYVFFNEWTPYGERHNYLLEADVGISLHGDHIETRFAVRTRLMDYLWVNLPMVVSGGDILSDLVERHQLGRIVTVGDAPEVAQAITEMLHTSVPTAHFQPVTEMFQWSCVAKPLQAYVENPWRNGGREINGDTAVNTVSPASSWRQILTKSTNSLRAGGIQGFWRDLRSYLYWIRQQ